MRSVIRILSQAALAIAALVTIGISSSPSPRAAERPDARLKEEGEERKLNERRALWNEEMRRTPEGVDWRAIQEANWRGTFLERQGRLESGVRSNLWDELGSANLAGRTHVTVLDPAGGGGLLLGSANGGVWNGNLNGATWAPKSDAVGYASEHLVAVSGPPEVWVSAAGNRVHATTNRGSTWFVPAGLPETINGVHRMVREPGSSRRVFLLVDGWQGGLRRQFVCRSDNGGVSFSIVNSGFAVNKRPDLWTSRTSVSALYLMHGESCHRSTDGGATFTLVGTAPASASRAVVMGCEAGAPTLYSALLVSGAWKLYRSTDAGATWSFRSNLASFYETLGTTISNPNVVFYGEVNCWRSTNGGSSFTPMNQWWEYYGQEDTKLHADIFGIDCVLYNGTEYLFFDTDGGTYLSDDLGVTVDNISQYGLGISQYYSILTSVNDPYLIGAGAQDQGYQISQPELGGPYLNFVQAISGDYGHTTSSDHTLNMAYSCYPGFTLVQENEVGPTTLLFVDFPPEPDGVSFLPFLLADRTDPNSYYFCARHIWHCTRVSGETYANTMLPFDFGAGLGHYVTAFAISPVDSDYWYVATNVGRLYRSTDAGANWSLSASTGPQSHYFYGTALEPSITDREVCYVGGNGYSGPAVYKTTDGGVTFEPMGTGLPSTLVLGLALTPDETLYAAAESGPYVWNAGAGSWQDLYGTEAPLTTFWDVESVPALGVVRFATYGRGIWDYTIPGPAAIEAAIPSSGFELFPNPTRREVTVRFSAPSGPSTLELFDVSGRLLAPARAVPAGETRIDLRAWSGRDLPQGVYLMRARNADGATVRQLRITG